MSYYVGLDVCWNRPPFAFWMKMAGLSWNAALPVILTEGAAVVYFRENFHADKYFYTIRLPQPTRARAKKS